MKNIKTQFAIISIVAGFVCFMIALSIFGGLKTFSPIPFGDSWNGVVDFYFRVARGESNLWWSLHNEHRIFISRIFFWVDTYFFKGLGGFLIIVNYLLLLVTATFFSFLVLRTNHKVDGIFKWILCAIIFSLTFSWVQNENITWAFQSQFFLAQLIPLLSLYFSYLASVKNKSTSYFLGACILAIASSGTMANGVIVLPILILYGLLSRQKAVYVIGYSFVAIVVGFWYFQGYVSPANHGSLVAALKGDFWGLIKYTFAYLGSPWHHLLGDTNFSKKFAFFAGAIFTFSSIYIFIVSLKNWKSHKFEMFLLLYILYIGGTAFGTAGGRLIFGVDQALSSRYTTPALFGWMALTVLVSKELIGIANRRPKFFAAQICILFFILGAYQIKIIKNPGINSYDRLITGIALTMGVEDKGQIQKIYPSYDFPLKMTTEMQKSNYYFPNYPPFNEMKSLLGKVQSGVEMIPLCDGYLDEVYIFGPEDRYLGIRGWMYSKDLSVKSSPLRVLNSRSEIIGFALLGDMRPDVANAVGKGSLYYGYRGYIKNIPLNSSIFIISGDNQCKINAMLSLDKQK